MHTCHDERRELERLREAVAHYDAALSLAFPEGAQGEVFAHWNAARDALRVAGKEGK